MSKAIFRYLRGELNGFYLTSLHNTLNTYTSYIKDFFAYFKNMQFDSTTMSQDTIYNIGKIAGVFLPRLSSAEGIGALKLSESHLSSSDVQVSERGLYNIKEEKFEFVHLSEDFNSTNDINNEATEARKSSLVGVDDTLKGYIPSSADNVVTDESEVDEAKVVTQAPEDEAYSEFYGNKFSFLSNPLTEVRNISIDLFYPLFKVMQWIRYNGANIASLCKTISILCPSNYVRIINIETPANYPCFMVNYTLDSAVSLDSKLQRVATLKYVVVQKFPQFRLNEVISD